MSGDTRSRKMWFQSPTKPLFHKRRDLWAQIKTVLLREQWTWDKWAKIPTWLRIEETRDLLVLSLRKLRSKERYLWHPPTHLAWKLGTWVLQPQLSSKPRKQEWRKLPLWNLNPRDQKAYLPKHLRSQRWKFPWVLSPRMPEDLSPRVLLKILWDQLIRVMKAQLKTPPQ